MAELDTPPAGSAHRRNQGNGMQFGMDDHGSEGWSDVPNSAQGFERPDQTVFDLSMEYSDDDVLLDWEQYTGMKRLRFCGRDCSWVLRWMPFVPVAPEWWYRFSRRQRKLILIMLAGASILIGLIVAFSVLAALLRKGQHHQAPSSNQGGLTAAEYASYDTCSWSQWRLPTGVKPTLYSLQLETDMQEPYDVTGHVNIQLEVAEDTPCIVLHSEGMYLGEVSLDGVEQPGVQLTHNDSSEQTTLQLERVLKGSSTVTLGLVFNYTLAPGLSGFYRSTFTAQDGTPQTLATTQFEAGSAHEAFPCFDEPALKAAFEIKLRTPVGLTALTNMPLEHTHPAEGGLQTSHFQTSPPMSTYLVAFIVGNLTHVSTTVPAPAGAASGESRPVSIYGTPQRAQQLQFALTVTAAVLTAFEQLFGVPFTLPKLDLVAIPDFGAGAMENWGLITYRETALLIDPASASIQDYRYVSNVIAHEMTHQWFGDLVTMDYWGELWLNEGFATYFEEHGATAAQPSYRFYDTFFGRTTARAMREDAKNGSTHPLATLTGVDSTGVIEYFFDGISYQKGGAVLHMIRAYLNRDQLGANQYGLRRRLLQADAFIQGLQAYLNQHALGTATSAELWAAVAAATGQPVGDWMQKWTYESGFPLLNVTLSGAGGLAVSVSQAPFATTGPGTCTSPWWVPLSYITRNASSAAWSPFQSCTTTAPVYTLQDSSDWVKLNAEQYGMYRVNYPVSMWANLAAAAANATGVDGATAISANDLAGLLSDAWALSETGVQSIAVYLELLRALGRRVAPEDAPWSIAAGELQNMRQLLQLQPDGAACITNLDSFVGNNLTGPWLAGVNTGNELGVSLGTGLAMAPPESSPLRLARYTVLSLAADFNSSSLSGQAVTLLQKSQESNAPLEPDTRLLVYRLAIAGGGSTVWNTLKQLYIQTSDATEKDNLLRALTFATDPQVIQQTLQLALDPVVRPQDMATVVVGVAAKGGVSLQQSWAFLQSNYSQIQGRLGSTPDSERTMGRMTQGVGSYFATQSAIDELNAFSLQHPELESRYFENAIASVQSSMDWLQHNANASCEWLRQLG